jgi:hypothetical protein
MNTQHTPGPLHNVTGARPGPWIRQVLNDESEAYIHDKHCNAIARVYSLSDAALIAAAPAMYEALRELTNAFALVVKMTPYGVSMDVSKVHDNARAALAQAEGRDK